LDMQSTNKVLFPIL
jgi:hypothetical protein